jgi:hypothetical protein
VCIYVWLELPSSSCLIPACMYVSKYLCMYVCMHVLQALSARSRPISDCVCTYMCLSTARALNSIKSYCSVCMYGMYLCTCFKCCALGYFVSCMCVSMYITYSCIRAYAHADIHVYIHVCTRITSSFLASAPAS